jgi:hypothetical protein
MANTVLLNNVDHQQVRVITRRAADYGDGVMYAVTFPSEFRSVQAHYPIVFRKTSDGSAFQPIALFGFQEGQNLFLDAQGWDASYIPLAIERQPFLIGAAQPEDQPQRRRTGIPDAWRQHRIPGAHEFGIARHP